MLGDAEGDTIGRLQAPTRKAEVDTHGARQARQEEGAADIGKQTDEGLGHRKRGAVGGDAVRAVDRNADAATHDITIEQCDVGLAEMLDLRVHLVLLVPEDAREIAASLAIFIKTDHIAARAEGLLARARNHQCLHRRIGLPCLQLRQDRVAHLVGERVEGLGAVKEDVADAAAPRKHDF